VRGGGDKYVLTESVKLRVRDSLMGMVCFTLYFLPMLLLAGAASFAFSFSLVAF